MEVISGTVYKTEVDLLNSRKIFQSNDVQIPSAGSLKYLGVVIDNRVSFRDHARYASRKAAMIATAQQDYCPMWEDPECQLRDY